jgi:hypothetical protein
MPLVNTFKVMKLFIKATLLGKLRIDTSQSIIEKKRLRTCILNVGVRKSMYIRSSSMASKEGRRLQLLVKIYIAIRH